MSNQMDQAISDQQVRLNSLIVNESLIGLHILVGTVAKHSYCVWINPNSTEVQSMHILRKKLPLSPLRDLLSEVWDPGVQGWGQKYEHDLVDRDSTANNCKRVLIEINETGLALALVSMSNLNF